MTALTDFTEALWLNRSFRGDVDTPPSATYGHLATSAPADDGTVSGTVSDGAVLSWAAASDASSSTDAVADFGTPAAQTWTHLVVTDSDTWGSGNVRYHGALDEPVTTDGETPLTIPAGDLTITVARTDGRGFTDYLANKNLDHDLRSATYAGPAVVLLAITDDTGVEVSGGGYAPEPVEFGAPSDDGGPMRAANTNSGEFTFGPGEIGGFIYREQGGQDMAVGEFSSARTVTDGSAATFGPGQFTVSVG